MKTSKLSIFGFLFSIFFFVSCSDNDDEPVIPAEETDFPSMQQYNDYILNHLWKIDRFYCIDDNEEEVPEGVAAKVLKSSENYYDQITGYYFCEDGMINFRYKKPPLWNLSLNISLSILTVGDYNPSTGWFGVGGNSLSGQKRFVSWKQDKIVMEYRPVTYSGDNPEYEGKTIYARFDASLVDPSEYPQWLEDYPTRNYDPKGYGLE